MFGKKVELNHTHLVAVRLMDALHQKAKHFIPRLRTAAIGFKLKVTEEMNDNREKYLKFEIQPGGWLKGSLVTFETAVRKGGTLLDGEIYHPELGRHIFRAMDCDGNEPTQILTIYPMF